MPYNDVVLGVGIFMVTITIIYFFQKTRWGIRIMSRESMRDQMAKEISDRLWVQICDGKKTLDEAIKLSNTLGEFLELPELISVSRLKRRMKRRIRELKQSGKPKIPGEKPLQVIVKNLWKPIKRLGFASFKLNG